MKQRLSLTFALLMAGLLPAGMAPGPAAHAQYYPSSPQARRAVRMYDRGYQEGYRAGWEHRGGSGAPGWMTAGRYRDDRREFRRGYHDGFERGKRESRDRYRRRW